MQKILIADASPANIEMICDLLGDEYEIIIADSGQMAINLATQEMPDLILLDIIMPEMNGLSVCKVLKNQIATAEIPVVFNTAISNPQDIVKAFEAGCQDYIIKPYYSRELYLRIKSHLEMKKSKDILKEYTKQLETKNQKLSDMIAKLEITAMTDYVTNLVTRRHMSIQIKAEASRLSRTKGTMSLIMADIDNFKNINDTYGHDCGDLVLKGIANTMKLALREQDVISRWGGEEFLLMLPDTDVKGGRVAAEKLRKAVETAKFRYKEKKFSVTMTLGVAEYDANLGIDGSIKKADEALYKGKIRSKNCAN